MIWGWLYRTQLTHMTNRICVSEADISEAPFLLFWLSEFLNVRAAPQFITFVPHRQYKHRTYSIAHSTYSWTPHFYVHQLHKWMWTYLDQNSLTNLFNPVSVEISRHTASAFATCLLCKNIVDGESVQGRSQCVGCYSQLRRVGLLTSTV